MDTVDRAVGMEDLVDRVLVGMEDREDKVLEDKVLADKAVEDKVRVDVVQVGMEDREVLAASLHDGDDAHDHDAYDRYLSLTSLLKSIYLQKE